MNNISYWQESTCKTNSVECRIKTNLWSLQCRLRRNRNNCNIMPSRIQGDKVYLLPRVTLGPTGGMRRGPVGGRNVDDDGDWTSGSEGTERKRRYHGAPVARTVYTYALRIVDVRATTGDIF